MKTSYQIQSYTRHLCASLVSNTEFSISITKSSISQKINETLKSQKGLYYSPIFPAFLIQNEGPPNIPDELSSIVFIFSQKAYNILGTIKPSLTSSEQDNVYFTQGLASLLFLNFDIERVMQLIAEFSVRPIEYWLIQKSVLNINQIVVLNNEPSKNNFPDIVKPEVKNKELSIYAEQIFASFVTLQHTYSIYFPEELKTIYQISKLVIEIFKQYESLEYNEHEEIQKNILKLKQHNALIAALVEISAALSYAVTQGTSGCAPILFNHSPFPHHSLLGVGSAVNALTKLTRYFESALTARSASKVISEQYSSKHVPFNIKVSKYNSGSVYKLSNNEPSSKEEFDKGGDFLTKNYAPLITHFSLRHGFKESKFSVTASSECLTDGLSPQWTLITLSHEIMHHRVREIFQALFGVNWDNQGYQMISKEDYKNFRKWYEQPKVNPSQKKISSILRNVIFYFCLAMDRYAKPTKEQSKREEIEITSVSELEKIFQNYKLSAVELFVHFHDYYFTYAFQSKIYVISLWASWIKVAAPIKNPIDYLIRTLSTIACGTGFKPRAAFQHAIEIFTEALDMLEDVGIHSPVFDKLKKSLDDENAKEYMFIKFKISYYLMDQIRLYFASNIVAKKIDRLDQDPFAEGSTRIEDYSSNIFVYGENNSISPVRFLLSSITKSIISPLPIGDFQWLSAWNTLIISSQEV